MAEECGIVVLEKKVSVPLLSSNIVTGGTGTTIKGTRACLCATVPSQLAQQTPAPTTAVAGTQAPVLPLERARHKPTDISTDKHVVSRWSPERTESVEPQCLEGSLVARSPLPPDGNMDGQGSGDPGSL